MTTHMKKANRFWPVFTLLAIVTLSVPCSVVDAGSVSKNLGSAVSTISHSKRMFPPNRFHHSRFLREPEIAVQQFQSFPTAEPKEPAKKGVYVQPHWVAGGYGVEVLESGHWVEVAKEAH